MPTRNQRRKQEQEEKENFERELILMFENKHRGPSWPPYSAIPNYRPFWPPIYSVWEHRAVADQCREAWQLLRDIYQNYMEQKAVHDPDGSRVRKYEQEFVTRFNNELALMFECQCEGPDYPPFSVIPNWKPDWGPVYEIWRYSKKGLPRYCESFEPLYIEAWEVLSSIYRDYQEQKGNKHE